MSLTPAQIIGQARQRYNAVGDSFFSDEELLALVWDGQNELALSALCIRQVFTTPSVADQQEYTTPTSLLGIFRATYDGRVLEVDTLDNVLRSTEGFSAGSGTPVSIAHWGTSFYLGPIPAESAKTIKTWCYVSPQEVVNASSLEVPARHQFKLVNFLLAQMAFKDNNERLGDRYLNRWNADIEKARAEERRLEKTGGFAIVRNEDFLNGVE